MMLIVPVYLNLLLMHEAIGGDDFVLLRENMVRRQIEARGVKDARVLAALRKVERHKFIPPSIQHLAYEDSPLPIGGGQTISQP